LIEKTLRRHYSTATQSLANKLRDLMMTRTRRIEMHPDLFRDRFQFFGRSTLQLI